MATSFSLRLATPHGVVFSGDVSSVIINGPSGSLGILANHAPLASAIVPHTARFILPDGQSLFFLLGTGVAQVADNKMTILSDKAEGI